MLASLPEASPPASDFDTVDADSVIAALETNGFHFSDVPLGSHFYIKVAAAELSCTTVLSSVTHICPEKKRVLIPGLSPLQCAPLSS